MHMDDTSTSVLSMDLGRFAGTVTGADCKSVPSGIVSSTLTSPTCASVGAHRMNRCRGERPPLQMDATSRRDGNLDPWQTRLECTRLLTGMMWGRYPRDPRRGRCGVESRWTKVGLASHRVTWPGVHYDVKVLQALRWVHSVTDNTPPLFCHVGPLGGRSVVDRCRDGFDPRTWRSRIPVVHAGMAATPRTSTCPNKWESQYRAIVITRCKRHNLAHSSNRLGDPVLNRTTGVRIPYALRMSPLLRFHPLIR